MLRRTIIVRNIFVGEIRRIFRRRRETKGDRCKEPASGPHSTKNWFNEWGSHEESSGGFGGMYDNV